MNFVAADLGASGTRYVSDSGKIQILPNNMVIMQNCNVSQLESNVEDIESNLEITIKKEGESEFFPVTVLAGKMADRFSSTHSVPQVGLAKYTQKINYISAVMSVAVSKLKFGLDDDIIYLLDVPPSEINDSKRVFKENLVGKYEVIFHKYMGSTTVKFNIVDVYTYEESVMATASFLFNMNGVPREDNKKFLVGRLLSLDIGASTTDLVVTENGKYQDRTGITFRVGGNIARSKFIQSVQTKFNIKLSLSDAEKALTEGRIKYGSKYMDVGDLVEEAKQHLARKLVDEVALYLQDNEMPLSSFDGIVVSGGGSMEGQYVDTDGQIIKTSRPLSDFIIEPLKVYCSDIAVVHYGEDARLANIKGLYIRAKLLMNKLAAANANNTVAPAQPVVQQVVAQPVAQQVVVPAQPVVQQAAQPEVAQVVIPTPAQQVVAQPVNTEVPTPVAPAAPVI